MEAVLRNEIDDTLKLREIIFHKMINRHTCSHLISNVINQNDSQRQTHQTP